MAESAIDANQEDKLMVSQEEEEEVEDAEKEEEEEEEEDERENGGLGPSSGPNASFLTKLNLILTISYLSLSSEECCDFEEEEKTKNVKDHKAKKTVSKLHSQKQNVNEVKGFDRRTPRFQMKMRDCRHCRKM